MEAMKVKSVNTSSGPRVRAQCSQASEGLIQTECQLMKAGASFHPCRDAFLGAPFRDQELRPKVNVVPISRGQSHT